MKGTVTISLEDFKKLEAKAESLDGAIRFLKNLENFKPDGETYLSHNSAYRRFVKENSFTIPIQAL